MSTQICLATAIILFTFDVSEHRGLLVCSGAGQGIGRAFAHALGEAGASVAVVDINVKKAQEVTEELRSKGIRSIAVGTDVTKKADCKKYLPCTRYWHHLLLH